MIHPERTFNWSAYFSLATVWSAIGGALHLVCPSLDTHRCAPQWLDVPAQCCCVQRQLVRNYFYNSLRCKHTRTIVYFTAVTAKTPM